MNEKRVMLHYIVAFYKNGEKEIKIDLNKEFKFCDMIDFIYEYEIKNECKLNYHYGFLEKE